MLRKDALARDVASGNPTWSNRATIESPARLTEFAMVAATATARFLPFLDPAEESALLATAPVKSFARDQMVFDQNVPLRAIFMIDAGSVRVEREDRGAMIPIAVLGTGEFFGEMSFVDGTPTSARVIADEPTELRMIDTATLDTLNNVDPSFTGRFYRSIAAILAERLRLTSVRTYGDQSWG
jgi:CRP-like cAMP-binding protein